MVLAEVAKLFSSQLDNTTAIPQHLVSSDNDGDGSAAAIGAVQNIAVGAEEEEEVDLEAARPPFLHVCGRAGILALLIDLEC